MATVAVGSTVEKEHSHTTVVKNSLEARQMSLHHTTHFYRNKILVVALDSLTQISHGSHCPRHVLAQLTALARQPLQTEHRDDRYSGSYQGHVGNYEPTNAARLHKAPVTTSLGDLLKNKIGR